jgi:peptidyl-prolyl cis-trans isomerase D
MATLQKMRNQAGLLIAIVIFIALAAFILGDLLQSGSSLIRGKQLEIAKIGNESVEYPEFQSRFEELANNYKANNQVNNLDEKAYKQILNQTWEMILQEKIMDDVYEDLGIDITPEEMFDMVQGNNLHPIIVQIFGDPQTRQVNKSQIIQFLKYIQENPDAPQRTSWLNIEKQIINSKKSTKYNTLVGKALYANSLQAQNSLKGQNITADLKFIQKKLLTVPDSVITYSEDDLKDYYKNNLSKYEQKAQKRLAYITYNIVPSEEDDAQARKWINDIKTDFEKAEDNIQFVNMNADTRFEDVYLSKSELTPNISEWAFNASLNDIYGPVKEGNTYKIYKLNDTKMLPDSVRASHILLRVENATEARIAAKTIDSLKNVLESGQATFEQVARDNSQDGSASQGGDLGWFGRGKMVAPFEKAAFHANVNELVTTQTQFGYHIIKVTRQSRKSKHVQLAIVDREVIPSSTTYQHLYTEASKFAANAQNLEGLKNQAEKMNKNVRYTNVGENDRSIPELGPVRTLIHAAFSNSSEGELVVGNDGSPVFEIEDKFIIAAIESETETGVKPLEDVKSSVELAVVKAKKIEKLLEDFSSARGQNIEETAQNLGLEVQSASGFNVQYGSVNAIGYEPAINGAVIALEVNEQSEPIAGRAGVYIIELTKKEGTAPTNIEAEKQSLFANLSYRASYLAYETLKNNTKIEDKRSKFY